MNVTYYLEYRIGGNLHVEEFSTLRASDKRQTELIKLGIYARSYQF